RPKRLAGSGVEGGDVGGSGVGSVGLKAEHGYLLVGTWLPLLAGHLAASSDIPWRTHRPRRFPQSSAQRAHRPDPKVLSARPGRPVTTRGHRPPGGDLGPSRLVAEPANHGDDRRPRGVELDMNRYVF